MGKLDHHVTPPIHDLSFDGSGQGCPECGHEREVSEESWVDRLAAKLGFAPGPAECEWRAEVMADTCGCNHHFHGS